MQARSTGHGFPTAHSNDDPTPKPHPMDTEGPMTTVMIAPTSAVITLDAVETVIREITLGGSPDGS